MPNYGIFGGNETPHNYTVQPTPQGDMSATVFGGMKEGMAMSDDLLKSKIEALQREQAAAMQKELGQAAENPDPQTLLKLSIKYPSLAKDFKISQDQLGEQQRKATLDQMLPVHAALNAGNTDAAIQQLQQQADAQRNSGKPQDAARTENMIKVIQTDPRALNTSIGIMLASIDPTRYAENFVKIQKAPADLEHTQAQTESLQAGTEKTQAETEQVGKPKEPTGWHAGIDKKTGQPAIFTGIGPDGQPIKVPGVAPVPQAAIVIDNRNKAAEAAGGIQANPLYAQAKAISDLKQGLPMRQGKEAAALNTMIAKIRAEEGKPPYDANQWTKVKRSNEYFSGNGKAAVTLTSNDVLYGHADEVLEALKGANLNDARVMNTVNQWYSRQTGKDANFKTLKVASKVFGAELGAMLGEKDAEERKSTQALFDSVDSPKSFIAAVEQSKKMAATRSAGLANQYYRETGLDPVEAGILPERVAKGAVNSAAAKGYKWADKYKDGAPQSSPKAGGATSVDDLMRLLGK